MKRVRAAVFATAMLCAWLGGVAAQAAPALWRVHDADSEIFLFGTLHALSPEAHWRTPAYEAAYTRADTIWFETHIDRADTETVVALLRRYGVDPERRLSDRLAPTDLRALSRQIDPARLDHLRPWAAALLLSMQPALERGASVERGADMVVTRQARTGAKEVRVFESLEDQARLFAGLPEPAELRYLSDVIRERNAPRRLTWRISFRPADSLEESWLAGDLATLGPELVGGLRRDNPALYEALLRRRNLAWAAQLEARMAGSGVELVNVGALHMVGPDGLPALLAARGYVVERVQ